MQAGVDIQFGAKVKEIEYKDGVYHVNGFTGKTFVAATGARGLVSDTCGKYVEQSFGISAQITGVGVLDPQRVYFWYENEETLDYFWAIPIEKNKWNIGFWMQRPEKDIKESITSLRKDILSN